MRLSHKIVLAIIAVLAIVTIEEVARAQYEKPISLLISDAHKQDDFLGNAWGWCARRVLSTIRPSEFDIQQMNQDAGARYIARLDDSAYADELLDRYIQSGLDLEALDWSHRWTAIQSSAIDGDLNAVKLLLAKGALPKTLDAKGRPVVELLNRVAASNPAGEYPEIIRVLGWQD